MASTPSRPTYGQGYIVAEPPWHFTSLLELRQGLHGLGATGDCGPAGSNCLGPGDVPPSRLDGRSDATVIRYTGYGEFRPVPKLTLALGARGQYAWKPLLSFEEFSAGNYTVGRGYDPGALLGDMGFGTQAEIRYGSRIPVSAKQACGRRLCLLGPCDRPQPRQAPVGDCGANISIRSAQERASIGTASSLDAGSQCRSLMSGRSTVRPDPRVLISLTTRLWPWRY